MNANESYDRRRSDLPDAPTSSRVCAEMRVPNAAELAQIYESLQRRERLLAASANASRLLLEAPDVMAAVPDVLRQLGEAADVDRVNLMLSQPGPNGEWLLVVASEWVAEGVVPHLGHPTMGTHDERDFARECAELRAGRSVCINKPRTRRRGDDCAGGCVLDGVGTKTKAIVPIFVGGEYVGVVGFDSTRQLRPIDSVGAVGARDRRRRHRRRASSRAPRGCRASRARARGRRARRGAGEGERRHPRAISNASRASRTCTASWATCCWKPRASSTPPAAR